MALSESEQTDVCQREQLALTDEELLAFAQRPRRTSVDGTLSDKHPLSDQLAVQRHLLQQAAISSKKRMFKLQVFKTAGTEGS